MTTPNRPPRSPAAQAVLDAAFPVYDEETLYRATGEQHAGMIAAAALRALADHLPPITLDQPIDHWSPSVWTRQELRNIAAELEAQP